MSLQLFTGQVISADPASFNVQVSLNGFSNAAPAVVQAVPVASVFADFLGLKDAAIPSVGSTVICLKLSSELVGILGVLPSEDDENSRYSTTAFPRTLDFSKLLSQYSAGYAGQESEATKIAFYNRQRPTDILPGDWVKTNDFGILLGLFQQFAVFKASELAQIQAFVFDDLLRIVSHNFQHITSLGELRIFLDGAKPSLELGLSHRQLENLGLPEVETPPAGAAPFVETGKITADGTEDLFEHVNGERAAAVQRLKLFAGALGDLLTIFLALPAKDAVYKTDGAVPAKQDTGLFHWTLSPDGGLYVRTRNEVFIEKTNYIRVPVRIRDEADPQGDAENLEYGPRPEFKWDFNTIPVDPARPEWTFLQLRDYAAFLQESLSYHTFKKQEKDIYVPGSREILSGEQAIDPERKVVLRQVTSGVYLLQSGGIVFRDAWGSAIVLDGGNIYLQPAKDLVFQPLGSLVAKVGKFISFLSRKDVEISTSEGAFRQMAKQAISLFSKESGILLESAAITENDGLPDNSPLRKLSGIVLKSAQGIFGFARKLRWRGEEYVEVHSGGEARVAADNGRATVSSNTGGVSILSKTGVQLLADSSVEVRGKSSVNVGSLGGVFVAGNGTTIIGNRGQQVGLIDEDGTIVSTGRNQTTGQNFLALNQEDPSKSRQGVIPKAFADSPDLQKIVFRYLGQGTGEDNYAPKGSVYLPATNAQQEDELLSKGLVSWDLSLSEVEKTFPYPGAVNGVLLGATVENQESVGGYVYNKFNPRAEAKIKRLSAQQYKVQK
jgi:hypothetical protein